MFEPIFRFLGVLTFVWLIYKIAILAKQLKRPKKDVKKYGDWSIVTGSTSGIGEAIAHELAKKGQNILLIGRTQEKLDNVKKDILSTHSNVQVETLRIDLSNLTDQNQIDFVNFMKTHKVGVLVNNAGLSYNYTKFLHEVSQKKIENMINVNSKSSSILTYLALKQFLTKDSKDKGCIINISSAGAIIPHQLHAVYSATKSYLNKFTLDLALEYEIKGVMFQVQLPYFVVSKMSKIRRPNFTTPSAKAYAEASVAQFGYSGLCFPYPIHALIFFVLQFIPEIALEFVIGNMHHAIRKKGNKKYGAKEEETFGFIKPDAIKSKELILHEIEKNGFKIIDKKEFKLSKKKAEDFYSEHSERKFFNDLVSYMTSGNVCALRLKKINAVKDWRNLMGPTDASKAKIDEPQSIRAKFGTDIEANAVHGSDSIDAAKREIQLIFE